MKKYCSKNYQSSTAKDLFAFPKEPFHDINAVGEPLNLSSLIENGDFSTATRLSRVTALEGHEKVELYRAEFRA